MRVLIHILPLVFVAAVSATAATLELNPGYDPDRWDGREPVIDPDFGPYGVPFGSREADVLAAFGDPRGVIIVNDSKKALMYGRTHMLIFRRDRLRELVVNDHLIDWEISRNLDRHPVFERKWILKPGIQRDMTYEDIMRALGKPAVNPDYQYEFDGERSTVKFRFSGIGGPGEVTREYRLNGFTITYYGD